MDASQLNSYRPVSNLPFLSKLLERAVQSQLQAFLDANSAMPAHHSAYRKHHKTETALIKVYDDLLKATDNGQMSDLFLLNLTAVLIRWIMNCYWHGWNELLVYGAKYSPGLNHT